MMIVSERSPVRAQSRTVEISSWALTVLLLTAASLTALADTDAAQGSTTQGTTAAGAISWARSLSRRKSVTRRCKARR